MDKKVVFFNQIFCTFKSENAYDTRLSEKISKITQKITKNNFKS